MTTILHQPANALALYRLTSAAANDSHTIYLTTAEAYDYWLAGWTVAQVEG